MPKEKSKATAKEQKRDAARAAVKESAAKPKAGMLKYAAAIIIVVVIIGAAIFAGLYTSRNQEGSFGTFKANFNSAPRVAIVVTAYNGTVLSGTVGCATAIILQMASSPSSHRNTSTIDFGIINQSSCLEAKGLLGNGPNPNYTTTSVQNCVNLTTSEPAIYINYSSTTNNTVIKPRLLYIVGTSTFLRQCGVAAEIS